MSRSLKEKSQKIQIARDEFQHKYMREPTVYELAELSGVPAEEIPEALGVLAPTLSLSGSSDDDEESDIPIDDSDRLFDRLAIIGAVSNLSYEEKMLVQYRFFDGKTQSDTAELLGISQVQVSRKEKNILLKMRQNLQE